MKQYAEHRFVTPSTKHMPFERQEYYMLTLVDDVLDVTWYGFSNQGVEISDGIMLKTYSSNEMALTHFNTIVAVGYSRLKLTMRRYYERHHNVDFKGVA
jgi:hypothetical protein